MSSPRSIKLGHGAGGRLTDELIRGVFLPRLGGPHLAGLSDAALLEELPPGTPAMTTDGFVVDPLVFPGAGFVTCDGTDWDCDGTPETDLVVGFLPGQQASWSDLGALVDLDAESAGFGACELVFVDIDAPVTESALDAAGVHLAFISSPGEACEVYDAVARSELTSWLDNQGQGILITGTLGDDGCVSYTARYELATLAGVTLSSTNPSTSVTPTVTRTATTFWTGIAASSFTSGGAAQGDNILGVCTGGAIDALVGNASIEPLRQAVAYQANPAAPCLAGVPTDHRGAWLPFQPEDGGDATDRRYLYNVLDWLKR